MPEEQQAPARVRVYRVIKAARPTREDFLSDRARNKRLRDRSPETLAHHEGFSVWRSETRVRDVASRFPGLGTHIAELELPADTSVLPFHDDPAHLTVLGEPDRFLQLVVRVVPLK